MSRIRAGSSPFFAKYLQISKILPYSVFKTFEIFFTVDTADLPVKLPSDSHGGHEGHADPWGGAP